MKRLSMLMLPLLLAAGGCRTHRSAEVTATADSVHTLQAEWRLTDGELRVDTVTVRETVTLGDTLVVVRETRALGLRATRREAVAAVADSLALSTAESTAESESTAPAAMSQAPWRLVILLLLLALGLWAWRRRSA